MFLWRMVSMCLEMMHMRLSNVGEGSSSINEKKMTHTSVYFEFWNLYQIAYVSWECFMI